MPRIHAGRSHTSRARSPATSTIGGGPVGTGGQSCARQRRHHVVGSASRSSTREVAATPARSGCRGRRGGCAPRSRRGRARCVPVASSTARACSADERHVVGPERHEVVRVVLEARATSRRSPRERDARGEHERDVDVAVLQPHPRFVQRPRAVHLDVRLRDRRPRAGGLEHLHERERAAGEVVGAARAREADVAAVDAGRSSASVIIGNSICVSVSSTPACERRLRERDDGDVAALITACAPRTARRATSGSPVGRQP